MNKKNPFVVRVLLLALVADPFAPALRAIADGRSTLGRQRPVLQFTLESLSGAGAESSSIEGEAALWTSTPTGVEVGPSSGPTFWVGSQEVQRATILLRVVTPARAGGRIGLSFGHRGPIAALGTTDADLLLLDWRSVADPAGPGLALVRIAGPVADGAFEFYQANAGASVVSATAGPGWQPGRAYELRIRYRDRRVEVSIDGQVALEATGQFEVGRLGYYANGAAGARYESLAITPADAPPHADAGLDQSVLTGGACQGTVTLNATASSDPDGDTLDFTWSGAFGSTTGARPSLTLPVGRHDIGLSVDDGTGRVDLDEVLVSVSDGVAPDLSCPADVELFTTPNRCDASTAAIGQAAATDACGADVSNDTTAALPVGRNSVEWTAVDASGLAASCTQSVVVRDGQRPSLSATVANPQLWPVNHTLVDVGLVASATDNCAGDVARHVAVWSDEPDESPMGDGHHPGDGVVEEGRLLLRAERKGNADGRVYLMIVTATDRGGNVAAACTTVTVPKSLSKASVAAVRAQATAAAVHCNANGSAPPGFHSVGEGYLARPNQPPTVDAGPDGATTLPDAVFSLAGSATDDGLPDDALGLTWSVVEEPADGHVAFVDASAAATEARFDVPGTYVLRLTAFDGALAASDDVRVVVAQANRAPEVDAGGDLEIRLPASATLDATASDDGLPSGAALAVSWIVVSGSTGSGSCVGAACGVAFAPVDAARSEASFGQPGTFTLRLTASDGELSASDDVVVTVRRLNETPQVSAGADLVASLPGAVVTLAGSVSDDSEPGGPLQLAWSVESAPAGATVGFASPASATTLATFDAPGAYVLRLTVSDGLAVASDDVVVTVQPENQPPVVDAGPDVTLVLPSNSAVLQGTAVDDGLPGGPLQFQWTFVSGPVEPTLAQATTAAVTATFGDIGTYVLRLTVNDGALSQADETTVTVQPPPLPTIVLEDGEALEGPVGMRDATVRVRLDFVAAHPVRVDYVLGSPGACNALPAFGRLEFAPGETEKTVTVRILGDLLEEADETLTLAFGNADGGLLPDDTAALLIRDDDAGAAVLAAPVNLTPPDGTTRLAPDTTLAWSPGPSGGPVTFDVRLGTAFSTQGQAWFGACPASIGPVPREGAAFAYDEANDRLFVFGGRGVDGAELDDLWVLLSASGESSAPGWRAVVAANVGPGPRREARAAYDPNSDRVILFGGCVGDCASPLADAYVLAGASSAAPEWQPLPPAPSGRAGHAVAYSPERNRLIVVGGSAATVFALADANGVGTPAWATLAATGDAAVATDRAGYAYDAGSDRLLLFGGRDVSGEATAQVSVLAGATGLVPHWHALNVPDGPTARSSPALGFDPASGRLVVFGGTTGGQGDNFVFGDTWLLDSVDAPAPTWIGLGAPGPVAPAPRVGAAFAYSAIRNRLVVALGSTDNGCQEGGVCAGDSTYFADAAVLHDAAGSLPLASAEQAGTEFFAASLPLAAPQFWKIVARGPEGRAASGPTWRFTPDAPSLEIADLEVPEGDGESTVRLRLVLSRPASGGESVTVSTSAGTADSEADFAPLSTTVVFAAGAAERDIEVVVRGDTTDEPDEFFVLGLSGASGLHLARPEARVTLLDDDLPENRAPTVDLGGDLFAAMPDASVTLTANVSDDALPPGAPLIASWSIVSAPAGAHVVFADATSPNTSAVFGAPGEYVLRLSVDDGAAAGSDEVRVTVDPANAPPLVDAGPDVEAALVTELLVNGGAEAGLTGWTQFQGTWSTTPLATPTPAEGSHYFHMPTFPATGELRQDVPLSAYAAAIDAGRQRFEFRALMWFFFNASDGRVIVEYRDAANAAVLAAFDTGYIRTPAEWTLAFDSRLAPPGARFARVRLLTRGFGGLQARAYIDALTFRAFPELPALSLVGQVSDDGLPRGSQLTQRWTTAAAPAGASLAFEPSDTASTLARVSAPGTYVARLEATDGTATASDETTIRVLAPDLPPAVDAGPSQSVVVSPAYGVNRLRNPGNELALVANAIPFWLKPGAGDWKKAPTASPYPPPFEGSSYFYAGFGGPITELRQDVDVADLAQPIDAGLQPFLFRGRVRSHPTGAPDMSRIVVEYADAGGILLDTFDSGEIGNQIEWQLVEDRRLAPVGTRRIRVRLLATTDSAGTTVDGFFDALQLFAPLETQVAVSGAVADDGLPIGHAVSSRWEAVSGPVPAAIGEPEALATTVGLAAVGTYRLRLTADDGVGTRYDETTVTVDAGNLPPAVWLGLDRALASTANTLALTPAVTDDGRPTATLTNQWTRVSGPGTVGFSPSATSLNSTLSFSTAGVYVVRLTVSDAERAGFDEITVRVGGTNQAPQVEAGADQVATNYEALLSGTVSDDGLPAPGLLALTWSLDSGPAPVTFGNPYAATTTVAFTVGGTYGLRLTASDGTLAASDVIVVEVSPTTLLPDLRVAILASAGVTYQAQTLALSGSLSVEIGNQGAGEAAATTLTVFEDLDGDQSFGPSDAVLGTAIVPVLAPSATMVQEVSVGGLITFPGAHLFAFADSARAVTETSEANNVASTAPACEERTEFATFQPVLKWAWTSSAVAPAMTSVVAAPAVFDLDRDGVPEVVFSSYDYDDPTTAVLRAISGADGREIWTASDPTLAISTAVSPAIGDLDGDGEVEILVLNVDETRVLAFDRDGRLKLSSSGIERANTSASDQQNVTLADLEGDGLAEIVVGRQVLNADGTLRWTGTGGKSGQAGLVAYHTASMVADLDMDGVQEVIAGNTAYRANGSIYWERTSLISGGLGNVPDGYTAIGNFDADPFPEIVLVGASEVRMVEHDGTLKWGPVLLPALPANSTRGSGGPPLVADVDDDGEPEIGIAGATAYTVFEGNGTVKWSRQVQDLTSNRTGSSAFDLEGDGSSEILYADERALRVYRGSDGTLLFETPMGSGTTLEYPIVADVDADGRADVVAVANHYGQTERAGVYAFKDAADQWVPTRRLWNQHSYHVTNVDDDGRVPRREQPSWLSYNSYRQNHLIDGCVFAQADLLPAYVRKAEGPTGGTLVTARIGNRGGSLAGPRIPVSFYSGDPRNGGALLGTVFTVTPLRPAAFEDISLEVPAGTAALPVWIWADDDGSGRGVRAESDEVNNVYESPVYVTATPNAVPVVDAGPDAVVEAPATVAVLEGSATDDGQPVAELTYTWGLVSAPIGGGVVFTSPNTAATSASFAGIGEYVLRLTAFDRDRSGSDEVTVRVTAANTAPTVDAGPDRRLYAPESVKVLTGVVTDDGLPYGAPLSVSWRVVSGPGSVSLASSEACEADPADGRVTCTSTLTAAGFEALGTYLLRLAADDGRGEVFDEVVVHYLPERVNQPPVVDAGPDTAVPLGTNLVVNGGAEDGLVGWSYETGAFTAATDDVVEGLRRFRALRGNVSLRQDIPVAAFVSRRLDLQVWHRADPSAPFAGIVVVAEFRSASGEVLSAHFTPDTIHRSTWSVYGVPLVPPVGAVTLRLVLIASSTDGALVRIDGVSLRPTGAAVPLAGTVTDDGLPEPANVTATWSTVSAPAGAAASLAGASCAGGATNADGDAAGVTCNATAGLTTAGAYAFRLTGADGALGATDEVGVTLVTANQRPAVDAGPNLTLTLPTNEVALGGSASDPDSGSFQTRWLQVDGPGELEFSDAASPTSTVRATRAGTYSLRLRAWDGDRFRFDSTTLVVEATGDENQAPTVHPGGALVLTLPTDTATLAGVVEDDGLPEGQPLTVTWAAVTGPGEVLFANASDPETSVQFGSAGAYRLRLTASDGEFTAFAEVPVTVLAEGTDNEPPTVSAGADHVISLPATTVSLTGAATDDGKPVGEALTLTWSVLSAPTVGVVTFANPGASVTNASFNGVGPYVLRLTASDGQITSTDDVVVRVLPANAPPTVDAGPDQAITLPPTSSVTLSATVHDDGLPQGGTVSLAWSVVSVTGTGTGCLAPCGSVAFSDPANRNTSATFNRRGTYVLRLTAADGEFSSFDEVTVVVGAGANQAPIVSAGPDQELTLPEDQVTLSGSTSDEGLPEPTVLTAVWSVVSKPGAGHVTFGGASCTASPAGDTCTCTAASCAATANFSAPGAYVLRLTANDRELASADDVLVEVLPGTASGDAPVVELTAPAHGASITAPTPFAGTITGEAFSWRLEYRPAGETNTPWTVFASGAGAVSGPLAMFDPTLLQNGAYEVRFVAVDVAGRNAVDTLTAVVKDNLKVGQFTVSFSDLEVPLSGLPIRITRSYDSRDKTPGDFGVGWRLDLSNVKVRESRTQGLAFTGVVLPGFLQTYCIQAARPPIVTMTLPDGRVEEYEAEISPQCQQFAPIQTARISYRKRGNTLSSLSVVGTDEVSITGTWPGPLQVFSHQDYRLLNPSRYRLTLVDGRELEVAKSAGLEKLRDLNANLLTVTAGGITHASGRGVTFTRDAQGRITRITDPEGDFITYGYDASGDLVSVTDREGNTTRFGYLSEIPHHLETIEDPLGRQPIRNEYGPDGRLLKHTDAFGKTIEYTHNLSANQEIVVDRNGAQRVLEYDSRGNVIREIQPDGRQVLRTYDARNNRLSETEPHEPTNPAPATTTFTYDSRDNLLSTRDPLGNTASQTYNARGQALTSTDARGKTTTNVYDVKGNLTSTTDADGNVTTFTYDSRGNVLSQAVTVDGLAQTTSTTYDGFGNALTETDADGHVTTSTYDRKGQRLTQSTTRATRTCTANGTGQFTCTDTGTETLTTTFGYDKQGRLTRTTDPDGTVSRTVYDALGRQVETFDKLGRRTAFEYDEMGRLTRTTHADLTTDESSYDNEGRRLTSKDRAGRVTSYLYDDLGRLVRTTFPDATFTESVYDAAGRLVESKDARGKSTTFEYDSAGRRTKVRDPLGNETVFGYDANGNQTSIRDARQNTTTFEYDDLNRRTKTLFTDGTYTETTYDELGRRVAERDQAGKVTRFEYDRQGRLVAVVDALNQRTEYEYDELGNRLVQRDANGNETRFEYDKLGREVARVLPDGARESKTYDAAGSLETWTDFIGRTTTLGYDVSSRLTSKLFHTGRTVGFTYSITGRRLTATDARGTTTFGYDNRDRLTSIAQPSVGSLGFTYNANGARETMTATVGSDALTTTYGYDDANRLDTVQDHLGRVHDFDWDPNGNRERLAHPNGVETTYQYSPLNRLTQLSAAGPLGAVFSQAFTLGAAGNRTRIDELNGVSRVYTCDDLYRLTSETVSAGSDLNYSRNWTYDAVGNRQQQVSAVGPAGTPGPNLQPGTVDYTYDSRDRMLTEVFGAATTTHSYDANGNLVTKSGELTLTWDEENRLIRMEKPDGTVIQTDYDVDGVRVRTTTTLPGQAAEVVDFLVDTSGGLSHVVAEVVPAGLRAVYVRGGDDLLSVIRPSTTAASGWESRFYTSDGIGSVRNLTDEAGTVTDTYSTDAFGQLLEHTGTDPQPYLFAGEPYDPNVGMAYHRARWMEPGTGRFLGMDPFGGFNSEPSTLHRYLYVGADPINSTDPTGLVESVGSLSFTSSLSTTVRTMAVPRLGAILTNLDAVALQGAYWWTWAEIGVGFAAGGLAIAELAALGMEDIASRLIQNTEEIPPGPWPRGDKIESIAGRNVAHNFPKIDIDGGDYLASIRSSDPGEHLQDLARRVQRNARELGNAVPPLNGRDAQGGVHRISEYRWNRTPKVLVQAVPQAPWRGDMVAFLRQMRQLSRETRVMIRVVTVGNWRRR